MLCVRRPSQSQAEEDDEEEERLSVKSVVSFSSPVKVKVPQLANFSNFSRVLSFSVPQLSDRSDHQQEIMRNLVRRYVTQEQRKAENEGVTEDDVNEIKNDISAFRFEMIEIMRASGMNTLSASGPSGPGGKKNRQKERRLMKGFMSRNRPGSWLIMIET